MKRNSTLISTVFFALTVLSFNANPVFAQCASPSMKYANAILVSGTAGAVNAKYKFPSVINGVDAYFTITAKVGGATLTSIDDNTYGYSAAWQPVVKTPTTQGAGESYIGFKVEFKDSADGQNHVFNCFQLSFIDIDGDNSHVKEFVAAKDYDTYTVASTTTLTLTQEEGLLKAMGTVQNYAGLDTSAWVTNINYNYKNTDKIGEIRVGNKTDNSFTVQDRFTCGYFKGIEMQGPVVLAVKYLSFDAAANGNAVNLKWITQTEINHDHFEVERSFDNNNFKTIAVVLDGIDMNGTQKTYMHKDNSEELKGKEVVYYRLKAIDKDGVITYSKVLAVRLSSKNEVVMTVSPNPFAENLTVRFNSTENGQAEIRIISITGQKLMANQSTITKGYNNIQLGGLAKLNPGVYVAQLIMNGKLMENQKVVKN